MHQWDISTIYENEEDRHLARVLVRLILASWGVYLFVIFTGFYYRDWTLIAVTLTGCVLLISPMILVRYKYLRAASIMVMLLMLGTMTIVATVGQGIHDLAVVAYPIIFIFAGLTLDHGLFRLCVGLTFVAVGWLVFGESFGWFVPRPFDESLSNWFNFITIILILSVAALAVDLLTSNMRRGLEQAKQEIAQRKVVEEQLRHKGTHDALTGIYNRSFFETELTRLERSREFPVSVIIVDVDRLKVVNDTRGHATGDEMLRQTTDILCSSFRSADMLARIGGDEFAILLPSTDSAAAERIVLRIKNQLQKHNAETPGLKIQLSIGTATAKKQNLTKAFALADKRMYAEKASHKSSTNFPTDA